MAGIKDVAKDGSDQNPILFLYTVLSGLAIADILTMMLINTGRGNA